MSLITGTYISVVFIGCCVNVLILEKLTTHIPGIANLITFLQFLFISIEGFFITTNCGKKQPQLPVHQCLYLVILFFVSSVCNNYAYNFNVPNAMHIIIKSGSLVTNMIMGIIIKRKRYSLKKYIATLIITSGIIICTMASAKNISDTFDESHTNLVEWSIGVSLLMFALVIGTIMGFLQESLYLKCGKHPKEMLYYTHLLPLPLFVFLFKDLIAACKLCNEASPIIIPLVGRVSSAWVLLLANVLTQYLCISSVYRLSSECTSLTVTLVLTLRKFVSLVFSVVFFYSNFSANHWLGTFFVFFGTALFLDLMKFESKSLSSNVKL